MRKRESRDDPRWHIRQPLLDHKLDFTGTLTAVSVDEMCKNMQVCCCAFACTSPASGVVVKRDEANYSWGCVPSRRVSDDSWQMGLFWPGLSIRASASLPMALLKSRLIISFDFVHERKNSFPSRSISSSSLYKPSRSLRPLPMCRWKPPIITLVALASTFAIIGDCGVG